MHPAHIDDFYYVTAEVLNTLYAAFPVRHLVLVEDITGPIRWDMTGLPDRKSRACFETLIWLADCDLIAFRTVEPRDLGIEGAWLTQKAFALLTGTITWNDGSTSTRIAALRTARSNLAYDDLGTLINNMLDANCRWAASAGAKELTKAEQISVADDSGSQAS